jgi:hypothetical protein
MTQPKFYRYYPAVEGDEFAPNVIEACLKIPGAWTRKDGCIEAALNCAYLVEGTLLSMDAAFKWWTPKVKVKQQRPKSIEELIRSKGLRAVDPKTGIPMQELLFPWQPREVFKHADHDGCLFQWPTGSGKSLGAMLWGLLDDGPVAIVTGAKGRLQWRDQIKRYTTHTPYVLAGTGHLGEAELQLYEVPKLDKRKFPADVRAYFEGGRLSCDCEAGTHRKVVFTRGRKLLLRVHLPPGRHALVFTVDNVSCMPQVHDVVDPGIPDGTKFVICSWETLPYHIENIIKLKPATAVLDESHRGKNHRRVDLVELTEDEVKSTPKAKQLEDGRWVKYVDLENTVSATQKLCKKAQRRVALTATPIKDRPRDLWAQLDYLTPWGFGRYWDFARRYCAAVKNTWGGIDDRGMSNMDELTARVSFLRSYVAKAESDASLPAMRRDVIYLPPDAQQREDEGFAAELEAAARAKASVHSILNIRLAAACSRKRKAIIDQIAEEVASGSKVTVFTARHNDVDVLKAVLPGRLGKNARSFFSDGRDSADKRYAMSREYMELAGSAVFVGTGQAFGEQIDLNETDIAHFVMLPYTIAELIQWEGRFIRGGSTRPVLINYWIAEGTVDERVASILLAKLPAIEKMGTEGVAGMRASFVGNEAELLESLAKEIMAGGQEQIEMRREQ